MSTPEMPDTPTIVDGAIILDDAIAVLDLLRCATGSEDAPSAAATYGMSDRTIGQAAWMVMRLLWEYQRMQARDHPTEGGIDDGMAQHNR